MNNYLNFSLLSNRLKLIPVNMQYANDICTHLTVEIARYMWPSAPKTLEEITQHITVKQNQMSRGEELSLLILDKQSGEFLGYTNIHQVNSTTPELGIWLKQSAHGKKYAYEALNLLVSWAENHLDYDYLKYPVDKMNLPSCKLAEKLGGIIEDEYVKTSESGNLLDEVEYRLYKKSR